MKIRFVEEIIHGAPHWFTEKFEGNETMGMWQFVSDSLSVSREIARGYFEEIKTTGRLGNRKILEEANAPDL